MRRAIESVAADVRSFVLLEVIDTLGGVDSPTQRFQESFSPSSPRASYIEARTDVRLLLLYAGDHGLGYVTNLADPDRSPRRPELNQFEGVRTGLWEPPPEGTPGHRRYAEAAEALGRLVAETAGGEDVRYLSRRSSRDRCLLVRVSGGDGRGYRSWVSINAERGESLQPMGGDAYRVWRLIQNGPRPEPVQIEPPKVRQEPLRRAPKPGEVDRPGPGTGPSSDPQTHQQ